MKLLMLLGSAIILFFMLKPKNEPEEMAQEDRG
jgi:hypothetical protein